MTASTEPGSTPPISRGSVDAGRDDIGARNRRSRAWLRIRIALCAALALVIAWLGSSAWVAWRSTRRPHARVAETIPESLRSRAREARFATSDGEDIGAWWIEGRGEGPCVILLHGHGGSRTTLLSKAEKLEQSVRALLLVSLRAHGDSSGEYCDFGYSARRDVIAAVAEVERLAPGAPIVIDGASMGAAAAIFSAPELGARVRGYVLEHPYRDLRTALWNRLDDRLPPPLASIAYAGLRIVGPLFIPDVAAISPSNAVVSMPRSARALVLASREDSSARLDEAREIQARCGAPCELVVFEHGAHDRIVQEEPARWAETVLMFIARCAQDAHR